MKLFKNIMATLTVALLATGTAIGPASADTEITEANNRVAQFIKLTNNKGSSSGINLSELPKEDARFIGIYLTNFIIPYATAVNGNDDITKTIKDNMKKHLVDVLGMSEGDASAIAEWAFAEMQNSSVDLKWKFSNEGNAETGAGMVEPPKDFIPTSNYEVQKMIAGEFLRDKNLFPMSDSDKIYEKTGDARMEQFKKGLYTLSLDGGKDGEKAKFIDRYKDEDLRYAYLVDGSDNILFSVDTSGGVMTPSVAALMQSVAIADPELGYGSNFFDMTYDELKAIIDDDSKDLVKEDATLMSNITADSFGNLHLKGKNTDIIILPGASNPYVWKLKDQKGGQGTALQNAMFMAASAKGGIASPSDLDKTVAKCTYPQTNVDNARKGLDKDGDTGFRVAMGSEEAYFGSGRWFFEDNKEGENADRILGEIADGSSYYTVLEGENGIRGGLPTYYFGGRPGQSATFGVQTTPCNGMVIIFDKDALYNSDAVKGASTNSDGTGKSNVEKDSEASASASASAKSKDSEDSSEEEDSDKEDVTTSGSKKVEGFTAVQALQGDGTINAGGDSGKFQAKAELMDEGMKVSGTDDVLKGIADTGKIFDEYTAYSVYFTYLVALLGDDAGKDAIGMSGNIDENGKLRLPAISDTSNFEMSEEAKQANEEALQSQMDMDIKQWIWNLLHPQRTKYATQLINNKASAVVLDMHNTAIGVTNSKVVSGTTQYTGIAGYLTTPELKDIKFTKAIYDGYYNNFVYVLLAFLVFLILYWIFGQLTWKQAVIGFGILGTLAFISFRAVDLSINASNTINDKIYSDKVLYWAMYQNQAYSEEINTAATSESYEDYLQTQFSQISAIDINGGEDETGNTIGTGSIMLKWQGGKKLNSLVVGNGTLDKTIANIDSAFAKQGIAGLNTAVSGESYLNYDATYLYRSYIDANNYSRYMYSGFKEGIASYNADPDTSVWTESLTAAWKDRSATQTSTEEMGYNLKTNSNLRYEPFMSSKIVDNALARNSLDNLTQSDDDNIGIDTRYFNFGIPNYTNNKEVMATVEANVDARAGDSRDNATMEGFSANGGDAGYTNEDYYGLGAHAVYSESPYYYFSWNYYDQGMKATMGTDGYKDLLLGTANKSYFYNVEGNGGMRDYNDMRSLFTYVIPRLDQGNQIVRDFDRTYGLYYEVGVTATEGHWNDEGIADNPERAQKYWKNLQVARLYGIYSPWVDQLYATKWADSQEIEYQGKKVIIDNPLDPASYPEDRPMIFSESEMMDYGLEETQLTHVEAKILKVQRAQMNNMVDMLNYYNFEDSVLNTSVAMQNTFEFNKEFSDFRLFSDSITLYPQAFEQKNFSWDVYLRMYLAGNSNEDIIGSTGTQFYTNLVANTGFFTGVFLLISDYLAGTAYPIMRTAIIWIVAVMVLFHIFLLAVRSRTPKEAGKSFLHGIFIPLIAIFAVTVGYGWLFSLFMQSGSKNVTGTTQDLSFSLGSPVWALIFLIFINVGILILLWKMGVHTVKTAQATVKATVESAKGVAASAQNIMTRVSNGESFTKARAGVMGTASAGNSGGTSGTSGNGSKGTGGASNAGTGASSGSSTSGTLAGATGGILGGRGASENQGSKESKYDKEDTFSIFGKRKKSEDKSHQGTADKDDDLIKDIETKSKAYAEGSEGDGGSKVDSTGASGRLGEGRGKSANGKPLHLDDPLHGSSKKDRLENLNRRLDERSGGSYYKVENVSSAGAGKGSGSGVHGVHGGSDDRTRPLNQGTAGVDDRTRPISRDTVDETRPMGNVRVNTPKAVPTNKGTAGSVLDPRPKSTSDRLDNLNRRINGK